MKPVIEIEPYNRKVKWLVWYIVFLTAYTMCSCGTKKTHTETRRMYDAEYLRADSIRIDINRISIEDIIRREKLTAKITIKTYSEPDSTGRQYVIEETAIDFSSEEETETNKVDTVMATVSHTSGVEINAALEEEIIEDTKKDNRPFPIWVWWVIGVIILGLVIYLAKRLFC